MADKIQKLRGRKKAMFEALKKNLGIVTGACKEVGISRETHYRWLREDTDYKFWIEIIPDECIDFAESSLYKLINGGNVAATIFYLKCKAKDRGYIEKTEQSIEVKGDGKLIQVNIPKEVKELINGELQSNS